MKKAWQQEKREKEQRCWITTMKLIMIEWVQLFHTLSLPSSLMLSVQTKWQWKLTDSSCRIRFLLSSSSSSLTLLPRGRRKHACREMLLPLRLHLLKTFFLSEMLKYFISSSFTEEQSVRESRFGFSFFLLFCVFRQSTILRTFTQPARAMPKYGRSAFHTHTCPSLSLCLSPSLFLSVCLSFFLSHSLTLFNPHMQQLTLTSLSLRKLGG